MSVLAAISSSADAASSFCSAVKPYLHVCSVSAQTSDPQTGCSLFIQPNPLLCIFQSDLVNHAHEKKGGRTLDSLGLCFVLPISLHLLGRIGCNAEESINGLQIKSGLNFCLRRAELKDERK